MTGEYIMLNEELFEDKKDAEIARLRMAIEKFKEYDEERKKYYAKSLQRLGELESLVQEVEDKQGLECRLKRYKDRLSYLEQLIRAKGIQEDMTLDEAKDLIAITEFFKGKQKELQERIKSLSETVSELTSENIRLKKLTDK